MHCLQGLKAEEDFADVTLASDQPGVSQQAHRLVLAACSPYFRRILKENSVTNCCQQTVIILNDVKSDILNALMTYMYQGEVYLPEDRLPTFFKTAKSLEIKGIVEDQNNEVVNFGLSTPYRDLNQSPNVNPHPIGDLSLLAAAAATATTQPDNHKSGSISKRRKTMPRRLDLTNASNPEQDKVRHLMLNDENSPMNVDSSFAINLSTKPPLSSSSPTSSTSPESNGLLFRPNTIPSPYPPPLQINSNPTSNNHQLIKSPFAARAELLTIPNPNNCFGRNHLLSTSTSSSSPEAIDMSGQGKSSPDEVITPTSEDRRRSRGSESEGSKGRGVRSPDEGGASSDQQMATILGPSWKSRQPRLCTYCQRMFSNKFNLKQVN